MLGKAETLGLETDLASHGEPLLPIHGRLDCTTCWVGCNAHVRTFGGGRFQLERNPGAWGARNPRVLVLGQTKGHSQADLMRVSVYGPAFFNRCAFAGLREELQRIMISVGLVSSEVDFDALFTEQEADFHFGSLIRCTLTARNDEQDRRGNTKGWTSDSSKVAKAFDTAEGAEVLNTCTSRFLSSLPNRLRLVILLGNSDGHIKRVQKAIGRIYTDLLPHPEAPDVAFTAGGRTWVHLLHPANRRDRNRDAWLAGDAGTGSGQKALAARRALALALT